MESNAVLTYNVNINLALPQSKFLYIAIDFLKGGCIITSAPFKYFQSWFSSNSYALWIKFVFLSENYLQELLEITNL